MGDVKAGYKMPTYNQDTNVIQRAVGYVDGYYDVTSQLSLGPARLSINIHASAAKAALDFFSRVDSKFGNLETAMNAYVSLARINVSTSWTFRSCWWGAADVLDSTTLVKDCGTGNWGTSDITVPFWQFDFFEEEGLDWCLMGDCEGIGYTKMTP